MKLTHRHTLSHQITRLLIEIEANKKALELRSPDPQRVESTRKQSFLHSGLYSAKIEGNPLSLAELSNHPKSLHQVEVNNLVKTLNTIFTHPVHISPTHIRDLHHRALYNLRADAGVLRTEMSAIYNSSGVAIYLTPPPEEIIPTLTQMIVQLYNNSDHHLIGGIRFHYQFEKLHPFVDGNGRVGRLLLNELLFTHSYSLHGTIVLDEEIANNRSTYYELLATESWDITPFIEFLLECLLRSQNSALTKLTSSLTRPNSTLLPRRAELLAIITDHAPCSFDFLQRRFMAINSRTLHYDLQQLVKASLIVKLGSTRGALYQST